MSYIEELQRLLQPDDERHRHPNSLRKEREDRGLTLQQVANALGLTKEELSGIERGGRDGAMDVAKYYVGPPPVDDEPPGEPFPDHVPLKGREAAHYTALLTGMLDRGLRNRSLANKVFVALKALEWLANLAKTANASIDQLLQQAEENQSSAEKFWKEERKRAR